MWSSSLQKKGILYALGAYLSWGILPIYWKALEVFPASFILAHRIIWSFSFLSLFLTLKKGWREWCNAFSNPASYRSILLTALIIGSNWYLYIWAINSEHLVEASLGYYINPLISVLLGVIFLREHLRLGQKVAFGFAFLGVSIITVSYGRFPWISFALAFTFGFYGLLRKVSPVGSLIGLTTETGLLSPLALAYLCFTSPEGGKSGESSLVIIILLVGAGIVTATPLLWFTKGVRRVPLNIIGFLQYISPSLQLFLGTVIFKEPFSTTHLLSFILIWIALAIFSLSQSKIFNSKAKPLKKQLDL